jgi:hypothetical protein
VLAQLVEDLVHLEAPRQIVSMSTVALIVPRGRCRALLRQHEDVVPQPRLEVALQLRQVEVRAGAAREQRLALWKK